MLFDTSSWSNSKKANFLAVLAHELTVSARGTYEVGTNRVLKPELLREFNEIEHRVTASLRSHLRGTAGIPLDIILKILIEFGENNNIIKDMQYVISRAQELTMRSEVQPPE
jgi:hypothetical protein